jgi:hypothetical protein
MANLEWLAEMEQAIADAVTIGHSEEEEVLRTQVYFPAFFGLDAEVTPEERTKRMQVCFSCSRADAEILATNREAMKIFWAVNPGNHLGLLDNFTAWKQAWISREVFYKR